MQNQQLIFPGFRRRPSGEPPVRLPSGASGGRPRRSSLRPPGAGVPRSQALGAKPAAWTDQKRRDLGEMPAMSPDASMLNCSTNRSTGDEGSKGVAVEPRIRTTRSAGGAPSHGLLQRLPFIKISPRQSQDSDQSKPHCRKNRTPNPMLRTMKSKTWMATGIIN